VNVITTFDNIYEFTKDLNLLIFFFLCLFHDDVQLVCRWTLVIGWRTSAMVVPAEEERTAKVVVAAVSCYRWRACVDVNDTRSDIMTSRSQSSPALTTALLLLLLDTVFATVSITRHHRGDVFDVSGKRLRRKRTNYYY